MLHVPLLIYLVMGLPLTILLWTALIVASWHNDERKRSS